MVTHVHLPDWLDRFIFDDLGANYCCVHSNMTVIDWSKEKLLCYLGTYFPRSFAESYCIFHDFFLWQKNIWSATEKLSVFDFGCGTGGEVVGFLLAMNECHPAVQRVQIVGLDGNQDALRLFEKVLAACVPHLQLEVSSRIIPVRVDDFYDLGVVDACISERFDLIMSFKSICEFVTQDRFERQNAYEHFARTFMPKLKEQGVMLLADVSSYNHVSEEWLPLMMDSGLSRAGCRVVRSNEGYNQSFTVSHSQRVKDVSKIAWKIIAK